MDSRGTFRILPEMQDLRASKYSRVGSHDKWQTKGLRQLLQTWMQWQDIEDHRIG